MNKNYLLHETIAILSADIYRYVYDRCEVWTEACSEIIRLAEEFEKKLNWQENDERDFIMELDKFEKEYLGSIVVTRENKTLHERYEELFGIEIEGLKRTVTRAGGEVRFYGDDAPLVMVNFDDCCPHPADVAITRVRIEDGHLLIDGIEKEQFDEKDIYVRDISYGHVKFITDAINEGRCLPVWDKETLLLSDGSFCSIDTDNGTWEYQEDADDDDTYVSGSFITDDRDEDLVVDYDGIDELPKGVIAALIASGYKLDL